MENAAKLIGDIFAMSFDVINPISGNLVAILAAALLFSVRYCTFCHREKKFAGQKTNGKMKPRTALLAQGEGTVQNEVKESAV